MVARAGWHSGFCVRARCESGALGRERVETRRRAERAALDPERVGSLLVRRDQEHVHGDNYAPRPEEAPDGSSAHARRAIRIAARLPVRAALRARSPAGDGGTLRVHYLDEGPATAPVVLLMHGEPSWSFLYRKMIPSLVGGRASRASHPTSSASADPTSRRERSDYTYARHVEWMRAALFDVLDLRDVTLVCQDWGGLIGLRLVGEHPDRFARVVAANTFLPTGDTPPGKAFLAWQRFSQTVEDFTSASSSAWAARPSFPTTVIAGYNAPFPDDRFKAGARQFPMLVPTTPDDPAAEDNRKAWKTLRAWDEAVPHRVLRRGRDHARRRPRIPARHTGLRRSTAHDHRGRRALPPGRPG